MSEQLNKLQQALGGLGQNGLNLKPSLETNVGLQNKDGNLMSLGLGQKFSGSVLNHDPKSVKDPKGKNKQVLKGNSKSMRH